jgi:hypothetical protein
MDRHNERVKLSATALDTLGVALLIAGVATYSPLYPNSFTRSSVCPLSWQAAENLEFSMLTGL